MLQFIIDRLKEPSSYAGLSLLVALVGYKVSPEFLDSFIALSSGFFAFISVILREKDTNNPQ